MGFFFSSSLLLLSRFLYILSPHVFFLPSSALFIFYTWYETRFFAGVIFVARRWRTEDAAGILLEGGKKGRKLSRERDEIRPAFDQRHHRNVESLLFFPSLSFGTWTHEWSGYRVQKGALLLIVGNNRLTHEEYIFSDLFSVPSFFSYLSRVSSTSKNSEPTFPMSRLTVLYIRFTFFRKL